MNDLPAWLTDVTESSALEAMLSSRSPISLETLAAESKAITLRRFGRTMMLYAPLYLSNFCSSGCTYCGFASDRKTPRRRLETEEIERELDAMKAMGIDDVLLLTGETHQGSGLRLPAAKCRRRRPPDGQGLRRGVSHERSGIPCAG